MDVRRAYTTTSRLSTISFLTFMYKPERTILCKSTNFKWIFHIKM